jgi:hypothetical protein
VKLNKLNPNGYSNVEEYNQLNRDFLDSLDHAAFNLNLCMTVSFIHLLFPLNTYMDYFFIKKTKRKAKSIDITFYNELCLFTVVIEWIRNYSRFSGNYNPEIPFADPEMSNSQLYICNLIWCLIENIYPFAFLMAMIASNTWVKLLFKMRGMKAFGPLFKVIK